MCWQISFFLFFEYFISFHLIVCHVQLALDAFHEPCAQSSQSIYFFSFRFTFSIYYNSSINSNYLHVQTNYVLCHHGNFWRLHNALHSQVESSTEEREKKQKIEIDFFFGFFILFFFCFKLNFDEILSLCGGAVCGARTWITGICESTSA